MSLRNCLVPIDGRPGLVLALSGGGFRAAIYHLGALRRLNAGGLLSHVHAVSSASGGSWTNAVLASRWKSLRQDDGGRFTNFDVEVVQPLRALVARNYRDDEAVKDLVDPSRNLTEVIADELHALLGGCLLGELPDGPRFVFNACAYATGKGFTFSRDDMLRPNRYSRYLMGDYLLAYAEADDVRLADAVMASSAFPALPPLRLRGRTPVVPSGGDGAPTPQDTAWHWERGIALGDGGLYDNLGLEPVHKAEGDAPAWFRPQAVLVSDGGGSPPHYEGVSVNLVERLRFSIDALMQTGINHRLRTLTGAASGTWRLAAPPRTAEAYLGDDARALAEVRTDLDSLDEVEQVALQRQGWVSADAVLVRLGEPGLKPPDDLPRDAGLAAHLKGKGFKLWGNG